MSIVIVVIIIMIIITFKQGIYNYVPQTNRVSKAHSATAVLYLQLCATNKSCI